MDILHGNNRLLVVIYGSNPAISVIKIFRSNPLLFCKDEFPGGGLKRWRDGPVFAGVGASPAGRAPTTLISNVGARRTIVKID